MEWLSNERGDTQLYIIVRYLLFGEGDTFSLSSPHWEDVASGSQALTPHILHHLRKKMIELFIQCLKMQDEAV